MAYCTVCGNKVEINHKWCKDCGIKVEVQAKASNEDIQPLTLTDFSKQREKVRRQALTKKEDDKATKLKITTKTTVNTKKLVFVTVGIVISDKNTGELKKVRGRLPVQVYDTSNVIDLKMAAIEKFSNHDQNFCGLEDYVLLYPDMSEVVLLPGAVKAFKLNMYKADLGKPYSKCVFFLCLTYQLNNISKNEDGKLDSETDDAYNNHDDKGSPPNISDSSLTVHDNGLEIPTALNIYPPDILMAGYNYEEDDEAESNFYYTNTTTTAINSVSESNRDEIAGTSTVLSYTEKLLNLSSTLLSTERFELKIRRRKIFLDTMQKLKIHFKDGVKLFKVSFVGDDPTDGKGPLREFFSLLFEDAKQFILCSGASSQFTFLHITEKLKAKEFLYFGNLIALAIINECAGPRYFLPSLAAKLLNGAPIPPLIDDVADFDVQQKLRALLDTNDESSFQKVMDNFPEQLTAGVTKLRVDMSEKHSFIEDICFHYCLSICSEEIDEVIKGLNLLGLRNILTTHYNESVKEFVNQTKQAAEDLLEVFKTVNYTINSTEKKDKEEDIVYNFSNFLESLDVKAYNRLTISIDYDDDEEEEGNKQENKDAVESTYQRNITLIDVIRFCTGSKYILDSMKGNGTIKFIYPGQNAHGQRIEAHTCAILLEFPVTERYYNSPESFIENFCDDIVSSPGFGKI